MDQGEYSVNCTWQIGCERTKGFRCFQDKNSKTSQGGNSNDSNTLLAYQKQVDIYRKHIGSKRKLSLTTI